MNNVTPIEERREALRRLKALEAKVESVRADRRTPKLRDTYEARVRLAALSATVETMKRKTS